MKSLKNLFILILVFNATFKVISSNETEEIEEENNVLILTDDNYEIAISKFPSLLIKFYAPWCGHCKRLAPEFEKAAEELKKTDPNVRLAKLDCTIHTRTAESFGIEGYPSLKFFKGENAPIDYNEDRSAEAIVSWIKRLVSPIVIRVDDLAEFEHYISEKEVVVVYFGESEDESDIFKTVAENNENLVFLSSANPQISAIHNKDSRRVVLFKRFDEPREEFDGEFNSESLEKFVEINSIPLISEFAENTIYFLFNKQKSGIYLYRKKGVHVDEEKLVKELASKYRNKLITIVTDIVGEVEQKLAEYMDISENDLPCIKIHDVVGEELRKYSLNKSITHENIEEFVNQFLNGELIPEYKSEEVTEQTEDEATIKVVSKTFDKIVNDKSKDVLVIFYAPWCGHCKSFLPKIENVARLIQSIDSFVIAKFDATANDLPGLEIEGYPTIKLFPSNSKDAPIDFTSGSSENDILDFLREHHTISTISDEIKVEVEPKNENNEDDIINSLIDTENEPEEVINEDSEPNKIDL